MAIQMNVLRRIRLICVQLTIYAHYFFIELVIFSSFFVIWILEM